MIQFMPEKKMVMVGDKFYPAMPFPRMEPDTGFCIGYTIPVGETGKSLSIAIGIGSYSDNYDLNDLVPCFVDVGAEMQVVEVGFDFDTVPEDSEWRTPGFDVTGYVDAEHLIEMIRNVANGKNPW